MPTTDPLLPNNLPEEELPEELIGALDDDDEIESQDPNVSDWLDRLREEQQPRQANKPVSEEAPRPTPEKAQQPPQTNSSDPIKEQLHQKERERSKEIAEKLKSGRQSAQKVATQGTEKAAANTVKQQAVRAGEKSAQAAARAAAQATKQAAKQAAKQVAQTASKVAAQVVTKNPYVLAALGIILLVIIIVLIIVSLFSLGGGAGNGPARYPDSVAQQEQATLLAALSGDKIANNKTVQEVINDEKSRYQRMKANADKYSPNLSVGIEAKGKEFAPLLDSLLTIQAPAERKKIRDDLQKKMLEFEGTLPFGRWISQIALGHQNAGSLNFCKITGAGANVACASFVSTVLWEAAVPNPIQGLVDDVWRQPSTRIVVDRPAARSAEYYAQQKGGLQPGDLVFWGDGSCNAGGSRLFDHVGIYVGDDQAVDNSSSKEKILKRGAEKRSSCQVFNGAKRYGANQ